MRIAALYTCFNRRVKTLSSLDGLYASLDFYNKDAKESIDLTIYLTDDGCTDGTADAIRTKFPNKDIHILQGDGNLYWAGGMRKSWLAALEDSGYFDYYLLLNDDTFVFPECFNNLIATEEYCIYNYCIQGIYSGMTCSSIDPTIITYGGDIIKNKLTGRTVRVGISSLPQMIDMANANILLVPDTIVEKIGILYEGYQHSAADMDYSMQARKSNIPVLSTEKPCGVCDNDFQVDKNVQDLINMSLTERRQFLRHPLHSNVDHLTFVRRNIPWRYPFALFFDALLLFFPRIYFLINKMRGV